MRFISIGVVCVGVKVSRRSGQRGGRGGSSRRGGGGGGMVASQSIVQEPQNDMYCTTTVHSPYGDYYPENNHYYVHGAPPEMCHAHMCTLHGDFGEANILYFSPLFIFKQYFAIFANYQKKKNYIVLFIFGW